MKLFVFLFVVSFIGLSLCSDIKFLSHYNELGCKFVYSKVEADKVERCDCPFMKSQIAEDKCSYKGKEYDLRQRIEKNVADHECSVECMCTETFPGTIGFLCAQVECPEDFHPHQPNKTCIRQYNINSCCSERELCDEEEKSKLAACEWDSQTYKEGVRFYPKNTCMSCVCSSDFNGTLDGPWCKKINCGIELYHAKDVQGKCAPIYFESTGCCPIEWTCMKETDTVLRKALGKTTNPDNLCHYGNLTMEIGDELKLDDDCVLCKCEVPPLLSCVRSSEC